MSVQRQIASCIIVVIWAAVMVNCSDTITHVYDCEIGNSSGDAGDGLKGSDLDETDSDETPRSDSDVATGGEGQGIRPPGWEDFGRACQSQEDCSDIPGEG